MFQPIRFGLIYAAADAFRLAQFGADFRVQSSTAAEVWYPRSRSPVTNIDTGVTREVLTGARRLRRSSLSPGNDKVKA